VPAVQPHRQKSQVKAGAPFYFTKRIADKLIEKKIAILMTYN
jgi:hypothetical protein